MKKIFLLLVDDIDLQLGSVGAAMSIVFPMLDRLTHFLQFLGATGGLILLYLSVRHKILEIKKLKRDGRNK